MVVYSQLVFIWSTLRLFWSAVEGDGRLFSQRNAAAACLWQLLQQRLELGGHVLADVQMRQVARVDPDPARSVVLVVALLVQTRQLPAAGDIVDVRVRLLCCVKRRLLRRTLRILSRFDRWQKPGIAVRVSFEDHNRDIRTEPRAELLEEHPVVSAHQRSAKV